MIYLSLSLIFLFICGEAHEELAKTTHKHDSTQPLHVNADILSFKPRIMYYENFLSDFECNLIIDYAKNHSHYKVPVQGLTSVYLPEYPHLPSILQTIERRIGVITGQPPHSSEESLNIHHISRHEKHVNRNLDEGPRTCIKSSTPLNADKFSLAVDSVHHDKVQKEYSSSTVIVYLNNVVIGGGTVFPCATKYDFDQMLKAGMTVPEGGMQPNTHCHNAFQLNGRWFDGEDVVEFENFRKHKPNFNLQTSLDEVLLAAHFGCLDNDGVVSSPAISTMTAFNKDGQPAWITSRAVRTQARKGSAVIFFHDQQDSLSPDTQAWHAGCLPLSGDKWTMQKFKELPLEYRKKISYPWMKDAISSAQREL